MTTKQELLKQYKEWTIKQVKAQEYFYSLLPDEKGGEIPTFVLTLEYIAQIEKAEKELFNATSRVRDILQKLGGCQRSNTP